ncbi:MAG: hypothetical protein CMJ18_01510 [Phycisphaeraceae bacterium]|nr:hypothetical protein [Phycisphaeraceae bacterium]
MPVGAGPYTVHGLPPVTNERFLPDDPLDDVPVAERIEVVCARDEFEPASFAIRADQDLHAVKVEIVALEAASPGTVSAPRPVVPTVDVRVVKCWYQAGGMVADQGRPLLTPELLLHDDALVRVDEKAQANHLRTVDTEGRVTYVPISTPDSNALRTVRPRDARALQPLDVPAATMKQFWLTIHAPRDATPGDYRAAIRIRPANAPETTLPLRVRVLPFLLAEPALRYGIYYRGVLARDGKAHIGSEAKSAAQYLAEMRNLRDHGVTYPTIYHGSRYSDAPGDRSFDPELIARALALRREAGMPADALYTLGVVCGSEESPEELEALQRNVRKWVDAAAQAGWGDVHVYALDEPSGDALTRMRAAFTAVHEAGGKVFAAVDLPDTFERVGDLLDVTVSQRPPHPHRARQAEGAGMQIWSYGIPNVRIEAPRTFRRSYGLLLWHAGYHGACTYAYQHAFGAHIWNDFDSPGPHRDHVFAYPTVDGVIDTIQWEGFREGVDDVRYMTTLEQSIQRARSRGELNTAGRRAEQWIAGLKAGYDIAGDLVAIRRRAARFIPELLEPR